MPIPHPEFDDSDGCIYMAKHYVTAVSTVWAGLLDKGELGDDKGARNSRSKTPSAPYKTTTADASIDRRYFRVSNKKYQDVLEFWAICYASDDEIVRTSHMPIS